MLPQSRFPRQPACKPFLLCHPVSCSLWGACGGLQALRIWSPFQCLPRTQGTPMPPRLPMPWALAPAVWFEEVKERSQTFLLPCPSRALTQWGSLGLVPANLSHPPASLSSKLKNACSFRFLQPWTSRGFLQPLLSGFPTVDKASVRRSQLSRQGPGLRPTGREGARVRA